LKKILNKILVQINHPFLTGYEPRTTNGNNKPREKQDQSLNGEQLGSMVIQNEVQVNQGWIMEMHHYGPGWS
jgi:hypothetical protein